MNIFNKTTQVVTMLCLCLATCSSCSYEEPDGPHVILPFDVIVRFESAIGTNIADSLSVIDITKPETWNAKKEDIQVRVYRGSDHKSLEAFEKRWGYTKDPTTTSFPAGTYLTVLATDMQIFEGGLWGEETYTFEFKSRKLFGNDDVHTVKWFIHGMGRVVYKVYKCEIDGEDMPLSKSKLLTEAKCNQIHAEVTIKLKGTPQP